MGDLLHRRRPDPARVCEEELRLDDWDPRTHFTSRTPMCDGDTGPSPHLMEGETHETTRLRDVPNVLRMTVSLHPRSGAMTDRNISYAAVRRCGMTPCSKSCEDV